MLSLLEWEIVCAATCCRSCWLSRREWSCCTLSRSWSCLRSCTYWREWRSDWLHATLHSSNSIRIYTLNIPSANTVEPTTIIFVCIQIKRNQKFLTTLDVELSKTICSENIEAKLLWILLVSFDNERLSLPLTSCRNAASFRQNGNHLSL